MTNSTNEEFDSSAIEEVLATMSKNFRKSDEDQYGHLYAIRFPKATGEDAKVPTPREFNSAFFDDERMKSTLARMVVDQIGVPEDRAWRAVYVYNNYSFIKSFISALVSKFEGGACSVDKTSWLISRYIKIQKTGDLISFKSLDEQPWNAPQILSVPMWVAVLDELPYFQNGKYKKLPAFLELLENHYATS